MVAQSSVRAGGIRGYVALMLSLDCDPVPLLARHGLSVEQLADEDCMLPLGPAVQLIEDSAVASNCPDFALRLAQVQDINILGPIAVAMQNCPTLARALETITNYLFIQSTGLTLKLEAAPAGSGVDTRLVYRVDLDGASTGLQIHEHGLAIAHKIIAMFAGPAYRLIGVALDHEPPAGSQPLLNYFHAPIWPNSDVCALYIGGPTLESPLPSANPALLRMAEDYLDTHFANPSRGVAARARQLLSRRLGTLSLSKEEVARTLAMHPRTLQRHLDAEGTSFNAVRDEVRREAALRYLAGTQLPLVQVASLTGFSEQSAFTRFCRQKLGRTPQAIRAHAVPPRPAPVHRSRSLRAPPGSGP